MRRVFFLLVLIVVITPVLGVAQEQVAFDHDGELFVIDRSLRNQLELFPEYEGFIEATLFRLNDQVYQLNVLVEVDGTRQRRQEEYSRARFEALRERVTQRLAELEPELDQSGRTRFLIGTTLLSAAYYAWATPTMLGVTEPSLFGTLYLFVTSSGYFVPNWVTSDATITSADTRLSLYGGVRGIYHGGAISNLLAPDETGFGVNRSHLAIRMATSIAGLYSGYAYSRNRNFTEGKSRFFNVAGDYGILMGGGTAIILEDTFSNMRLSSAGYLSIATAGYAGAHYLTHNRNATIGNARVMRTSYFLGAVIPAGFLVAFDVDSVPLNSAITMTGLTAGMGFASRISRHQRFTEGQGTTIRLGTFGSYLIGAGLGLLATDDSSGPLIIGALSGSIGYFMLLNRAIQQNNPDNNWLGLNLDLGLQPVIKHDNNSNFPDTIVPVLKLSKSF